MPSGSFLRIISCGLKRLFATSFAFCAAAGDATSAIAWLAEPRVRFVLCGRSDARWRSALTRRDHTWPNAVSFLSLSLMNSYILETEVSEPKSSTEFPRSTKHERLVFLRIHLLLYVTAPAASRHQPGRVAHALRC